MSVYVIIWAFALSAEAAFALLLALNRHGRPRLEALVWTDWLFQSVQFVADQTGAFAVNKYVWMAGVLIFAAQLPGVLQESFWEKSRTFASWQFRQNMLHWWLAVLFACAWIRVFPYTGFVVSAANLVFFTAMILDKIED